MNLYNLSKQQIDVIKGIAILIIVFHNFLNWSTGITENEMQYVSVRWINYLDKIITQPASFLNSTLSYFGHYGVQLFIFASAYGLSKKALKKEVSYKEYIIPRLIKIYSLLIFALILILIFLPDFENVEKRIKFFFFSLSMLKSVSYQSLFAYVGPWWFFSLIVQFYLLFPFIFKFIKSKQIKGFWILFGGSYLLIYLLLPFTEKIGFPLFGNFLGHMPEFLLGILFACFSKVRLDLKIIIPALAVFILSNFFTCTFPLSFASVTIVLLTITYPFYRKSSFGIFQFFMFIGTVSMFMFVFNGPIRELTIPWLIKEDATHLNVFLMSIIHTVIVVLVSYILSIIYKKTFDVWSKKLSLYFLNKSVKLKEK